MSQFLEAVRDRIVFYDGSMGATILNMQLTVDQYGGKEGCTDYLTICNPSIVEQIHAGFLVVGADVLETNTFGGSLIKLQEYGLGEMTYDLNRKAAELAKGVAKHFSTAAKPRFVAGSIGPTGLLPASEDPMLGNHRFHEVLELFLDQIRGLVDGGADVLIIETVQDILELKAAIHAAEQVFAERGFRVPIQASITLDTSGRMLLGTDIAAALSIIEHLPTDIIGLNCSTGPEHMREPARYLGEYSTRPISIIPNAGIPINVNGLAQFPMEPEPMGKQLRELVEQFNVSIVGGCCGNSTEHIKEIVNQITYRPTVIRPSKPLANVASMIRAIDMVQEPAPLIVGERLNTQGSRKFKRLVLEDNFDGMMAAGLHQLDEGAHALDVCVALTERADEAETMRKLVKKLSLNIEAPLVIDSTEAEVVKVALEQNPGRSIVNSINMENGRERIEAVMPHVIKHGAAVIALTIDKIGMAKTRDRKLEVAREIHKIVTEEYGLRPDALIFDALTFTLATGDPEFNESAIETIEGIRLIEKELPGVTSILGVSNVSFGLSPAARRVLNAVFLYYCIQAGLDMAIIHPSHVLPLGEIPADEREMAEDLIFYRRPDALQRYIEHFEGRVESASSNSVDAMTDMDVYERLHYRIVYRKKEGVEADIDEAVATRGDAVAVLNDTLLPAMKEVGDKFGAGELILPFVLQSAEVMKKAVAQLETYLEKQEGVTKGTVVLATVYGDVHDIGKNLVNTILTNNGYTVYDLGKQVPVSTIIDKAIEVNATAIGLSALLVSTSKQMPLCVKELHHQGLSFPVIIGGAAINRPYAHRTLFVDDDLPYGSGVFYAKDAFEGLALMDQIIRPDAKIELYDHTVHQARVAMSKPSRDSFHAPTEASEWARSTTRILDSVPTPPFWGVREPLDFSLTDIWPHLDLKTMFRLHWGGKGVQGEAWEELLANEFEPRLKHMQEDAIRTGWMQPRTRYGYFPVNSDRNELIVFDPVDQDRQLLRFDFPRQPARERLCLSDYFLPLDAGQRDVCAFQIVTMGAVADQYTDDLQQAGEYSESFFAHGLSVQSAEGLAEYMHQRVRQELGIGPETGKRYSWGYPSCPDLEQHVLVDQLLDINACGIKLTEGFQFDPEQTTAAIVIHHPDAKYYALMRSGDREEVAV